MARYTATLPLPRHDNGVPFKRSDLEFHDLDHRGPSYEGRIFLNAPEAALDRPLDLTAGYAGSLWVFGHDHCWGDDGHCVPPSGPLHGYDSRPPHHLLGQIHVVDVTAAIELLMTGSRRRFTVTVVPVLHEGEAATVKDGLLRFGRLTLVTYD
jgi:hypothetical protein